MNMMDGPRFRRKHTSATGSLASAKRTMPAPQRDRSAQPGAGQDVKRENPGDRTEPVADRLAASDRKKPARPSPTAEQHGGSDKAKPDDSTQRAESPSSLPIKDDLRLSGGHYVSDKTVARAAGPRGKTTAWQQTTDLNKPKEHDTKETDPAVHDPRQERPAERTRTSAEPPLALTDMIPVGRQHEHRGPVAEASPPADQGAAAIRTAWNALQELSVDERHLDRNRIISASREDPAYSAFDVLRTRLLQALSENGWRRVAITSPGKNCGKTFTAANLAISLSRQENCRTMLLDFDMRRPSMHHVLGTGSPGAIGDMLRGSTTPQDHLRRMGVNSIHAGRNIAFGLNGSVETYASELLQDPRAGETLDAIEKSFAPDVMLFDLPPALFYDDVMAFRPLFDGVLLVVGGGLTTEREIKEVERRLGENTPLLGMVLNRAEGTDLKRYGY